MKVGFSFFGLHPRRYSAIAAKADKLGYESVWVPEHLVFPVDIRPTYPYAADGVPPVTAKTQLYDPWVTLSFVAAATENLVLGTNVYILPLRNPFVPARAVSTLDVLSNGRILLGCGIGWLQEEFDAVGEAWKNRAGRTTEIVEIIKKLWTEETIEYHGKYYNFGPVKFEPKPARKPRPPIQFGGETDAALRRAAKLGDGWIGTRKSDAETKEFVHKLRQFRKEFGKEREPFEITVGTGARPTVDDIRRLEEAGATRVIGVPWGPAPPGGRLTLDHAVAGVEDFADKVLSKLKK